MERDQSDGEKINKIKKIIQREIEKEIISKQDEVMEITAKIEKALRNLDILKYVVTVNYYENNQGLTTKKVGDQEDESKDEKAQTQIHPCVKKLLPFRSNYVKSFGDGSHSYETRKSRQSTSVEATQSTAVVKDEGMEVTCKAEESPAVNGVCNSTAVKVESDEVTSLPQYVPPLPNPDIVRQVVNSPRGGSSKVQHRIIIGNISKWIPPDTREDNSTHKWMVYIRNQDKDKDVTQLIRKVRYFLHESYKPHDIIDVTSAPFHLTRRGWGEFPIRVQLHFHHPLNKPVDIIHHLKLDMTCSGVQTLGAETVVEVCLHQGGGDPALGKQKKVSVESEFANGKRTSAERGDVFDGCLIAPVRGLGSGDAAEEEEEEEDTRTDQSDHRSESVQCERTNSLLIHSSRNLILDRRKLQEIIDREHDYMKPGDGLESAGTSFLRLINGKSEGSYRNGTVLGGSGRRCRDPSRAEVSLCRGESEVFLNLKSVVSRLEGESQSKYCMKVFRRSYLVNVLQRVHATKLRGVEALVRWFLRRWPIVTKLAVDPTYRHVHPYSCPTEEEFFQYNIGKQRSAEWFRAKSIQKILLSLKPILPIEEDIWTTKQILLWSRFHGYSPASFARSDDAKGLTEHPGECSKRLKSTESNSDSDYDSSDCAAKKGKSSGGKFVNGVSVVERKRNFKRGRKKGQADGGQAQVASYRGVSSYSEGCDPTRYGSLECRVLHCESAPEVDVVTVEDDVEVPQQTLPSDRQRKESTQTVVTAPPDELHLNKFVSGATRQIGIRLTNEELVPGVACDSAVRVMSQATLTFLEELLRKSLAQAWLRNGDRAPGSLEYDDVLATLMENPQFDVFTNRGLGIQPAIKSEH